MKILLSSMFGPYGVDDSFGRKENKMELFHNQVTREQGLFSVRNFHPSTGLHFIAENIDADTTVLDFPTQRRFIKEIKKNYDYVGLSFIMPNVTKAKHMASLIRQYAPQSQIVLGGHGTRIPDIEQLVEHDHICKGEGVTWFRKLLGENPNRPLRHPLVGAGFSGSVAGVPFPNTSGVLVPGVGCPNACRFCATSHFFDKKYTSFFETGQQMFDVCLEYEKRKGYTEFFIMDENFLKRPRRARELLECMEKHDKHYRFGIFSSAETVQNMGVEFMARLGVHFIWIGVESKKDIFEKNHGVDLKATIAKLRDHGISVLASGILFLEHHDQQTIWEDIDYLVDMKADYSQFMQLGPLPQTELYLDYKTKGLLREDVPYEHWHGQYQVWFNHPHFTPRESEQFLIKAFKYEYDQLGSSILRMCETIIRGFETFSRYDDPYMVKRAAMQKREASYYRPLLKVLERFAHNRNARELSARVAARYEANLGPMSLKQRIAGRLASLFAWRESWRIRTGRSVYQPKTSVKNFKHPLAETVGSTTNTTMSMPPIFSGIRE